MNILKRIFPLIILQFVMILAIYYIVDRPQKKEERITFDKGIINIVDKSGKVNLFLVEFAETDQQRERGLMFRQSMDTESGMIFVFDKPQPVVMWMKDTYIPLDIIFIKQDGAIISIAENTVPLSTSEIYSGGDVIAVLEINAMLTKQLGIKPGDKVIFTKD